MNIPISNFDNISTAPSTETHSINKKKLARLFKDFNLPVTFSHAEQGPAITRYNYSARPNINLNKLSDIEANISLFLAVPSVRVLAPVPSQPYIGVEIPNETREFVGFREIFYTGKKNAQGKNTQKGKIIQSSKNMELPIVLGKNITGKIITADLARLPHLLIAGATGSGKSICVNSIIVSLLALRSNVQYIMIDPKIVELKVYEGIPQLLTNVITNPQDAINTLQALTNIMQERYHKLEALHVRNLKSYNEVSPTPMPYIVCIIDEFADLVASHRKELDKHLATLSAMARATGIHLILATQRPSVDVITGVIKSNFPSRIAFRVPSGIDSRVILDTMGAENLLGKGDMLYREPQFDHPERIQGVYVSDREVHNVVTHFTKNGRATYKPLQGSRDESTLDKKLIARARRLLAQTDNKTTSYLQRALVVDFHTARQIIEEVL